MLSQAKSDADTARADRTADASQFEATMAKYESEYAWT